MFTAKSISHSNVNRLGPLSRTEIGWAVAAFAAFFPRGAHADIAIGIEDIDVSAAFQSVLVDAPARAVWGVRLAILVATLAPVFVIGKLATLPKLSPEHRERVIARLLASRIYVVRQLALLLKMMGSLLFARAPEVRRAMLRREEIPVPLESGERLIGVTTLIRGGAVGRRSA